MQHLIRTSIKIFKAPNSKRASKSRTTVTPEFPRTAATQVAGPHPGRGGSGGGQEILTATIEWLQLIRGGLEAFYGRMGPDGCKDKAERAVRKRKAGGREKERRRERKRKINERVCCDSCSNGAAIITIHQDNE